MRQDNPNGIKARRAQFAALCESGMSREAIAGEMCVSIDTVREHARNRGIPLPHSEYAVVRAPKPPSPEKPPSAASVTSTPWTEERIERLEKLWAQELSTSQIATRLGGVTRNGVIGKVHRLGLSRYKMPAAQRREQQKKAKAVEAEKVRAEERRRVQEMAEKAREREEAERLAAAQTAEPIAAVPPGDSEPAAIVQALSARISPERPAPTIKGVSIFDLNLSTCRWPLGKRYEVAERFCGEPPLPGRPYCRCHCKLAFQSVRPWRDAAKAVDTLPKKPQFAEFLR
jgi:GcrA cell cycle regulator